MILKKNIYYKGAFQFVVAGGFPFQGIKGSEMEKRQIEMHLYKATQLKEL